MHYVTQIIKFLVSIQWESQGKHHAAQEMGFLSAIKAMKAIKSIKIYARLEDNSKWKTTRAV